MRTKSWIALLMALLLTVPAAAGLAEGVDDTEYTEEPVLNVFTGDRPVKTEPAHITVANATRVSGSFFTSQFGNNTSDLDVRNMIHGYNLVYWSSQDAFKTDPAVVEDLTVAHTSSANRVYTVHLHDDLTYNDGETKITAADYVFSLLLQTSDEFACLNADSGEWAHVFGYEAYANGETDHLRGVHLIDEYTFSVTVKQPYEPYFYDLSYLNVYPYPISVLAPGCMVADSKQGAYIKNIDPEIQEPLFTAELLASTVLGEEGYLSHPLLTAGPYRLVSYDKETGTVDFAINKFYKGNRDGVRPWFDTVTLAEGKIDTMVSRLENGEFGLINKVVDGKVIQEALASERPVSHASYARLGYGFLAVACEQGPQQFQKVRQAVACCLDTDTFVADFLKGFGVTVNGYYGIGQWMYYCSAGSVIPENLSAKEAKQWDEVTLENLDRYSYDTARAKKLLIEDGWVLNEKGEAFNEEQDDVRYKLLADGSLMRLSFRYAQCEDNDAARMVAELLTPALSEVGAELVPSVIPFTELLSDYYREDGRNYDLSFMATNFVSAFDPYLHFVKDPKFEGSINTSGIDDEKLTELAWDMRRTQPEDYLHYLQKWQAFQERFNEILPTIPIYSNVYYDFYTPALKNYDPAAEYGWPTALLYAYLDGSETEPAAEEQ